MRKRKLLSLLMIFAIIFTSVNISPIVAEAAKTVKVKKVQITNPKKGSITMKKGETFSLKVKVTPKNAKNKQVSYKTSNRKVATVTSKGKIMAVKNGTAKITVTAKDGSGKKATCKVMVKNVLTVWCWDKNFNIYAMKQAEKIYQKKHPDFALDISETPWDNILKQLKKGSKKGKFDNLPDIILVQDNAFQNSVISYPKAFKSLTGRGINFSDFAKAKTAYSVVNGKNYGVPFDNGAVIACYRTDYLQQAGFTVEDFTNITWDEYLEKGKIVLEKTGKPMLSCTEGESDIIMMMLQSCGVSLFDKKGKPVIAGNNTLKKIMETYDALVKAGVILEVKDWEKYTESINEDKVAGVINGCWIMATIQEKASQKGKWAVTNMPKLSGIGGATNYSNNGGSSWAVTSNCQDVKLAADFLGKTFGGSKKLYDNILDHGALAAYLPAGKSNAYKKPQAFYGNDAVFAKIVEYSKQTPSVNTGRYYYESRDAVANALKKVVAGGNIDDQLKAAQSKVESIIKKNK